MLKSVVVDSERLDLDGMLGEYKSFWDGLDQGVSAEYCASLSEGLDDVPMPNEEEVDLKAALMERGLWVFLPVHESSVEDTFQCIDGQEYETAKFDIGEMDSYGVLLEPRGKQIALHPALYDGSSGPFPRLKIDETASVVEKALASFMTRHIRS